MWNLKKKKDTIIFFADFEKHMITKGDRLRGRDRLGVWDGNAIKLGCDNYCTTINKIKFIELNTQNERVKNDACFNLYPQNISEFQRDQ